MRLSREDYDRIFRLLNKANNEGKLVKQVQLDYYLKNEIIAPKYVVWRDSTIIKVFYKLKLSSNEFLFFEDYPLNVFTNLGFLVGDEEEIVRLRLRNGDIFYTVPDLVPYIEEEILEQRGVSFKGLPKTFFLGFKQPSFIRAIKEYVKRKGVDLDKIHRVRGKGFRCFCPNRYNLDFKVALLIPVPLVRFFDGEFVRDSVIHVRDVDEIIDSIQPYKRVVKVESLPFHKKKGEMLIRDISNEFHLRLNEKKVMELLDKKEILNISKFRLLKSVAKRSLVKITSTSGDIKAPIWYCSGCYLTFPSVASFEEVVGRPFDPRTFEENVIYCKDGYRAEFEKKFFLIPLSDRDDKIYFNSVDELLVNLYLYPEAKKVVLRDHLKENEVNQLFKVTKKLMKHLISKCISFNKMPKLGKIDSVVSRYLYSVYNHLGSLLLKVEYEENIKETSKCFISKGNLLLRLSKLLSEEDLYGFFLVVNRFICFAKFLNVKIGSDFERLFLEYFEGVKVAYRGATVDFSLEKTMENILKYINKPFGVYFKKDLGLSLSGTRLKVLTELPPCKFVVKPNRYLIARDFPKSYRRILSCIKASEIKNMTDYSEVVKFDNFEVRLDKNYFLFYRKFRRFKCIYEDKEIIILKPKFLSFSF